MCILSPQIEKVSSCLKVILSCACDEFGERGCDCCRVVMTFEVLPDGFVDCSGGKGLMLVIPRCTA